MSRISVAAFGPGDDRSAATVERRAANQVAAAAPCSVVAETPAGRLVGLAISRQLGDRLLLAWAAVDPEFQGRGILRAMLAGWPGPQSGLTRMVVSSTDPAAMRAYAGLDLQVLPTVSAGGILRPGAVELPRGVEELSPLEAEGFLGPLGASVRGTGWPRHDLEMLEAQGDRVHVVDDGVGRQAAVIRGGAIVRMVAATDEASAIRALRAALASAPPGATVHLNHLRAGMDWAIRTALDARLVLSPEGPVYADGPLSPWHLPSGALG
ncbi:MAG: GNAT family N-acetyltransferase [Patulibacter minatonensis]